MTFQSIRPQVPSNRSSAGHVGWVDGVKGLCIIFVVLGHTITELDIRGFDTGTWGTFNMMLGPVRMPLFFLASGLFAAKALASTWGRLANRRIWVMVWLYLLWVPLRSIWLGLVPGSRLGEGGITSAPRLLSETGREEIASLLVEALYAPTSYLWFLYALALFAVLSKTSCVCAKNWPTRPHPFRSDDIRSRSCGSTFQSGLLPHPFGQIHKRCSRGISDSRAGYFPASWKTALIL